jgi:hypothetical protein
VVRRYGKHRRRVEPWQVTPQVRANNATTTNAPLCTGGPHSLVYRCNLLCVQMVWWGDRSEDAASGTPSRGRLHGRL